MIIPNPLRRNKKLFKTMALQATIQMRLFRIKNQRISVTDLSTGVGDLDLDEVEVPPGEVFPGVILPGEVFPGEEAKVISLASPPTQKIETNPSTRTNLRNMKNDHYLTRTNGGRLLKLKNIPVGGRLHKFRQAWKGAAFESVIKNGLSWSWKNAPPVKKDIQQQTSPALDWKVKKLSNLRVIEKTPKIKFQSRLFLVPKKDDPEERLIIDLSMLNKNIKLEKFKMLTMNQVRLLLPKGCWTVALDLKDGYWHVPVTPKKRPYLGFKYRGRNWQFKALPFGLNLGPRIFTKLIAHVIKALAAEGIWCLPYLDDLLIISNSKEECLRHSQIAISIIESFGWIINQNKSRVQPEQTFQWLGALFDLQKHTVQVPQEKMDTLKNQISQLAQTKRCTRREIMRLQGLANWIGQFNPSTRPLVSRTRILLRFFKRNHLDASIRLTKGMKLSIVKWCSDTVIPQALGTPSPSITIQTDASLKGYGFRINQKAFHGRFDQSMTYSINTLELLTIWYALLMVSEKNVSIQIRCDNTTAVSAIRRGTSVIFHLTMLSELIWKRACALNWTLSVSHIQGKFNILADQLSRGTTISTEWSLPPRVFQHVILRKNPKLQVDLFATSLNHQLKVFISPCPDQEAVAVDAMSLPWDRWEHLYAYPPTSLISRVLAKLKETQFKSAILITPDLLKPWFLHLQTKSRHSETLKVRLQQMVKGKLVQAHKTTTLRVWTL